MRLMHFGFALPGRGPLATPEILTKLAEKADALRYTSLFVTDHVVIPTANNSTYPYSPSGRFATDWTNGYLEPIAMMGVLVGLTSRIKLGTSVLVVPYRNPVVTAKMLATLDVMSGGRLILGAGVGWMREEFEAVQAPAFHERGRVTDEYLRLMRIMWTKEPAEFSGAYYRLPSASALPKPRPAAPASSPTPGIRSACVRPRCSIRPSTRRRSSSSTTGPARPGAIRRTSRSPFACPSSWRPSGVRGAATSP